MKLLPLAGTSLVVQVDSVDFAWALTLGLKPRIDRTGKTYAVTRTGEFLHRLIYFRMSGERLGRRVVDHRDGHSLNNQRTNLRAATHSQNAANRRGRGELKGVRWDHHTRSYIVTLTCRGKRIRQTGFTTADAAAAAYDALAKQYFGDFAWLNAHRVPAATILRFPEFPPVVCQSDLVLQSAQLNHYGYSCVRDECGRLWLFWKQLRRVIKLRLPTPEAAGIKFARKYVQQVIQPTQGAVSKVHWTSPRKTKMLSS